MINFVPQVGSDDSHERFPGQTLVYLDKLTTLDQVTQENTDCLKCDTILAMDEIMSHLTHANSLAVHKVREVHLLIMTCIFFA